MECVKCVCVWILAAWGRRVSGCENWVWFYQSCGNGGVLNVCVCLAGGGEGGVGGEWVGVCTRVWRGGVVLYDSVSCESGSFV